jgi:hypothetical protein
MTGCPPALLEKTLRFKNARRDAVRLERTL